MIDEEEIYYRLAILSVKDIGIQKAKILFTYFPKAKKIYELKSKDVDNIKGIERILPQQILKKNTLDIAEKELKHIKKNNIHVLFFDDPLYPKNLLECRDCPCVLFIKGNKDLNFKHSVSIVGTRKPSNYGKKVVSDLINDITTSSPTTISGLAYGIDTLVHQKSIDINIPTVAILGNGMQHVYPPTNAKLSEDILKKGGSLVTEFFFETPSMSQNFPCRNRIIAGLSESTIIVETKTKGGSMITAKLAYSYNKPVFCFPGKITDPLSAGCLHLLKNKQAEILIDGNQFIYEMQWSNEKPLSYKNLKINFCQYSKNEQIVLNLLKEHAKLHIDSLIQLTQLSNTDLASILLQLELLNIINNLPGNFFALK